MQFRLDLELSAAEGALVRVLGMIERRGFTALAIEGARADGCASWQVRLTVQGHRPPATLCHQLEKLYDCTAVRLSELTPAVAA